MVALGLATSRTQAQALILAGQVVFEPSRARVDKPGLAVASDAQFALVGERPAFVSRGGDKLAAALSTFAVCVQGKRALDVGASTGGFTDCLLQKGAAEVTAVDVGYNQLAYRLRQDSRVIVRERVNMREPPNDLLKAPVSIGVVDVSFISLGLIVPPLGKLIEPGGTLITLIKPQFEVGQGEIGKGGIVRSETARLHARDRIIALVLTLGWEDAQHMPSPLLGAKGNHEFLLSVRRSG